MHSTQYKRSVSLPNIRAVWREISRRPHASCREIAADLQIGYSSVSAALWHLGQAGYVETIPGRTRARRVLVPFVEVGR